MIIISVIIIIKWSIYQRLSSSRRSPSSLVTCWTQWGLLGKCLNTWTERLWSAQTANSNLISWEDTSASRVSASPILQTPTKQCCRWDCRTDGLVSGGGIVLSIYSVTITTAGLTSLFSGLFLGAEAWSDDGTGGSVWRRKKYLRESAGAFLRASAGRNPAGWRTAKILWSPVPPQEGDSSWILMLFESFRLLSVFKMSIYSNILKHMIFTSLY